VYNNGGYGGGLWVQDGALVAINNTFSGNTCDFAGCGIYLQQTGAGMDATLRFNTIANNKIAGSQGVAAPGLLAQAGVRLRAFGNVWRELPKLLRARGN